MSQYYTGKAIRRYTETLVALGIAGTFTGTRRDASHAIGGFGFRCFADQVGTLLVEDSINGTTWRTVQTVAIGASVLEERLYSVSAKYMRVTYTNGGVAQTVFELSVALLPAGA